MPTNILTDAKLFAGAYNISPDLSLIRLTAQALAKDDTTFGAGYQSIKGGGALIKIGLDGSGFVQSGSGKVEDILSAAGYLGTEAVLITVAAESGDAGDSCRFFKGAIAAYDSDLSIGEMHKFTFKGENTGQSGDSQLIRATIFEDSKTSRTIAGNTATRTLGAVLAAQKVYAGLHLIAFNGTDLTFTLKSAVTDWATPTTRYTFVQNTAIGYEYATPVAGAITDTFWRFEWTGTFTSFSAVLVAGIQ